VDQLRAFDETIAWPQRRPIQGGNNAPRNSLG
jgi:hypothetical protein